MSETFPRDIERKAEVIAGILVGVEFVEASDIGLVARAIMFERERCARIADRAAQHSRTTEYYDGYVNAAQGLAHDIRNPKETK